MGDEPVKVEPSQIGWMAQMCHEANRAYCEAIGESGQVHWYVAPQWQKDSAIQGVRFALENPDATPADLHASWLADKVAAGWTHGEIKDAEAKTHPCLLPYEELPEAQRVKDGIFRETIRSYLYPRHEHNVVVGFKPGNAVKLRSGGPTMTVAGIANKGSTEIARCRWFPGGEQSLAHPLENEFRVEELTFA